MNPAIFIDAYISDLNRLEVFNENIKNYKKCGYDIFVISNKIFNFSSFSDVKYFEYDDTNRILPDKNKYQLFSVINWWRFFCGDKQYRLDGWSYIHGFTNWTILYNLKKIASVLKKRGYTHLIRCEYDVTFHDYDLMKTIFKNYGNTEKSKKCMILKNGWGVVTNFFLIDVDVLINKIPDMETEEDYQKFLISLYGKNKSPVFEELFSHLIDNECEFLNNEETYKYIKNINNFESTGDAGYRHVNIFKNLFMCPINDNTDFFIYNQSENKSIYVTVESENFNEIYYLRPTEWYIINPVKNFVKIKSSEMSNDLFYNFDLNLPCNFTFNSV